MTKPAQTPKKPARGQTGPKTLAGKITSSLNATKTGLHISGWIDSSEELDYQELFDNLRVEYNAQTTTLLLQIERMALDEKDFRLIKDNFPFPRKGYSFNLPVKTFEQLEYYLSTVSVDLIRT